MSKALTKAIDEHKKTAAEMVRVLKRDYPEGGPIRWDRNGIHSGTVVMHSGGKRIKVRNERTGKEFWIYAYSID
jgi:hypothetical protein